MSHIAPMAAQDALDAAQLCAQPDAQDVDQSANSRMRIL